MAQRKYVCSIHLAVYARVHLHMYISIWNFFSCRRLWHSRPAKMGRGNARTDSRTDRWSSRSSCRTRMVAERHVYLPKRGAPWVVYFVPLARYVQWSSCFPFSALVLAGWFSYQYHRIMGNIAPSQSLHGQACFKLYVELDLIMSHKMFLSPTRSNCYVSFWSRDARGDWYLWELRKT